MHSAFDRSATYMPMKLYDQFLRALYFYVAYSYTPATVLALSTLFKLQLVV